MLLYFLIYDLWRRYWVWLVLMRLAAGVFVSSRGAKPEFIFHFHDIVHSCLQILSPSVFQILKLRHKMAARMTRALFSVRVDHRTHPSALVSINIVHLQKTEPTVFIQNLLRLVSHPSILSSPIHHPQQHASASHCAPASTEITWQCFTATPRLWHDLHTWIHLCINTWVDPDTALLHEGSWRSFGPRPAGFESELELRWEKLSAGLFHLTF